MSLFAFLGKSAVHWYPKNALLNLITMSLSGLAILIFLILHIRKLISDDPIQSHLQRQQTATAAYKSDSQTGSNKSSSKNQQSGSQHSVRTATRTRAQSQSKEETHRYYKISNILTVVAVTLYCIHALSSLITFSGALNHNTIDCALWQTFMTYHFHTAKECMYLVFILRLEIAYDNSHYRINRKILYFFYAYLAFITVTLLVGDYTDCSGHFVWDSDIDAYWCQATCQLWGIFFSQAGDACICLGCLYLFIKPLRHLLKNAYRDERLCLLATKMTNLTVIAVLSSQLMFMLSAYASFGFLIGVDDMINAYCLLLMSSHHVDYYYKYCGCLDRIEDCCKVPLAKVKTAAAAATGIALEVDVAQKEDLDHIQLSPVRSLSSEADVGSPSSAASDNIVIIHK